jgi:hypothetical protein
MNISKIVRENDEEQSLPPLHQRLAGFCLILSMKGEFNKQTSRDIAKSAIIEYENRKLKRDCKMTMAEHIEHLNKLLKFPQQTIHQVASEIKNKFLCKSLAV